MSASIRPARTCQARRQRHDGDRLEMLGEVLTLVRKRGLDAELFLDILTSTMFGSRVHRIYGAKIAAQRYAASGFVLRWRSRTCGWRWRRLKLRAFRCLR